MNERTKKETKIHYTALTFPTLYNQLIMHAQVWFLYVKLNRGLFPKFATHCKNQESKRNLFYFITFETN